MALRVCASVALIAIGAASMMGHASMSAFVIQRGVQGSQLRPASPGSAAHKGNQARGSAVQETQSQAALWKFAACGLLLCMSRRRSVLPRQRSRAMCRVVGCGHQCSTSVSWVHPVAPAPISSQPPSAAPVLDSRESNLIVTEPSRTLGDVPQVYYIGEPSVDTWPAIQPVTARPSAPHTQRRYVSARFVAGARHSAGSSRRTKYTSRAASAAGKAERRAWGAKLEGGACCEAETQSRPYDASTLRSQIQRGLRDMKCSRSERGGREPKHSSSLGCDSSAEVSMQAGFCGVELNVLLDQETMH